MTKALQPKTLRAMARDLGIAGETCDALQAKYEEWLKGQKPKCGCGKPVAVIVGPDSKPMCAGCYSVYIGADPVIKPPDDWYDMMLDYHRLTEAEVARVGRDMGSEVVEGHVCLTNPHAPGYAQTAGSSPCQYCDERLKFSLKREEVNALNWLRRVWAGQPGPMAGFQRYLDGERKR